MLQNFCQPQTLLKIVSLQRLTLIFATAVYNFLTETVQWNIGPK